MIKKYRKKSVIVEAFQWDGKFTRGISQHHFGTHASKKVVICSKCDNCYEKHGWIYTLEGGYIVCPIDWIVIGIEGEKYPVKPHIFEQTYEEVK